MLQKHTTSQLTVLSDDAYAEGMARIEATLARAATTGQDPIFPVEISIAMVTGQVSGSNEGVGG